MPPEEDDVAGAQVGGMVDHHHAGAHQQDFDDETF